MENSEITPLADELNDRQTKGAAQQLSQLPVLVFPTSVSLDFYRRKNGFKSISTSDLIQPSNTYASLE